MLPCRPFVPLLQVGSPAAACWSKCGWIGKGSRAIGPPLFAVIASLGISEFGEGPMQSRLCILCLVCVWLESCPVVLQAAISFDSSAVKWLHTQD